MTLTRGGRIDADDATGGSNGTEDGGVLDIGIRGGEDPHELDELETEEFAVLLMVPPASEELSVVLVRNGQAV